MVDSRQHDSWLKVCLLKDLLTNPYHLCPVSRSLTMKHSIPTSPLFWAPIKMRQSSSFRTTLSTHFVRLISTPKTGILPVQIRGYFIALFPGSSIYRVGVSRCAVALLSNNKLRSFHSASINVANFCYFIASHQIVDVFLKKWGVGSLSLKRSSFFKVSNSYGLHKDLWKCKATASPGSENRRQIQESIHLLFLKTHIIFKTIL